MSKIGNRGEGHYACVGLWVYGKYLYCPLHFIANLNGSIKIVFKVKQNKKKEKDITPSLIED